MPDWVSANRYEGLRLQFDLATNKYFDNHLNLSVAYGLKDATYKGKAEVKYFFSRTPWSSIDVYYKKDLDDGQVITTSLDPITSLPLCLESPKFLINTR